ncbi:het and ankyrin domain protein [Colletotrichum karsti]|uniref:Het and ankyrin domain protein n=1 Tax=Colletotrichum karsti TaxID=1095194 RepID=A0A9P6HYY3_9PEZI|nr:het and ankyrin domain protein [Colletotrichum karsti]KAF9872994.1 het and ankyrin domain protein [Colletotrichum karsti]
MKLLNLVNGKLQVFNYPPPVSYAILSHTWSSPAENEWSRYNGTAKPEAAGTSVFQGILTKFFKIAREQRYEYVWIDALCVDKNASADISETINLLSRLYQGADICLVFLADLPCGSALPCKDTWAQCRFWNRAWTLLELVLPANIQFYDAQWHPRGNRLTQPLPSLISCITGIDEDILTRERTLRDTSIASKMSWAAHREGTRSEDIAYSLLGLFDVCMPIIYGEGGQRAFQRLQEEILKNTNDMSLFAWTSNENQVSRGLFAYSPIEFVSYGGSVAGRLPCNFDGFAALTSRGVLVEGQFSTHGLDLLLDLGVQANDERHTDRFGILLRKGVDGIFERITPGVLQQLPADMEFSTMRVMVAKGSGETAKQTPENINRQCSLSSWPCETLQPTPSLKYSLPISLKRPSTPTSSQQTSGSSESSTTPTGSAFNLSSGSGSDGTEWVDLHHETCDEVDSDDYENMDGYGSMETSQHTEIEQGWDSAQSDISEATTMASPPQPHIEDQWDICSRIQAEEDRSKTAVAQLSQDTLDHFLRSQETECHATEKRMRRERRSKGNVRQPARQKRQGLEISELACPFYKQDPREYISCLMNHELRSMEDVEDHIHSRHRRPFYCPICKADFNLALERDRHINQRICDLREDLPLKGVSEDMRRLISRTRGHGSETARWFEVWNILFPDSGSKQPSSPHLRSGLGLKVSNFRAFWRRHGQSNTLDRLATRLPLEDDANIEELSSEVFSTTLRALASEFTRQDSAF